MLAPRLVGSIPTASAPTIRSRRFSGSDLDSLSSVGRHKSRRTQRTAQGVEFPSEPNGKGRVDRPTLPPNHGPKGGEFMSKPSLKITITIHPNGSISLLIEWICSNLSTGYEMASPLCWG